MSKGISIILDPPHGCNVEGKRSPDGTHLEYKWGRDRVKSLTKKLTELGYIVNVTTHSEKEPGLTYRKDVASSIDTGTPKLLLSLHNNASGDGSKWMDARGIALYTTKGVTKADMCASFIIEQFIEDFPELKVRKYSHKPLEQDFESNFTVLMGNGYWGVLIEWLFQDNREDVELLKDAEMNARYEESLIKAIEKINEHFA